METESKGEYCRLKVQSVTGEPSVDVWRIRMSVQLSDIWFRSSTRIYMNDRGCVLAGSISWTQRTLHNYVQLTPCYVRSRMCSSSSSIYYT